MQNRCYRNVPKRVRLFMMVAAACTLYRYGGQLYRYNLERHVGDGWRTYSEEVRIRIEYALASRVINGTLWNATYVITPFVHMRGQYLVLQLGKEAFSSEQLTRMIADPVQTIYVVRNPLDRFVSGFIDKCINEIRLNATTCYGCHSDVDCVLRNLQVELTGMAAGTVTIPPPPQYCCSYETQHMAPQTWYCDLEDRYKHNAFVKHGSSGAAKQEMVVQIVNILRSQHVPEYKIDTIVETIGGGNHARHATHHSNLRKKYRNMIRGDKKRLKLFMDIYRIDFAVFGFDEPTLIKH